MPGEVREVGSFLPNDVALSGLLAWVLVNGDPLKGPCRAWHFRIRFEVVVKDCGVRRQLCSEAQLFGLGVHFFSKIDI
jgi:hypothetical protein